MQEKENKIVLHLTNSLPRKEYVTSFKTNGLLATWFWKTARTE